MPPRENDSPNPNASSGQRRRSGILNDSLAKRNNLYEVLELTKTATDDEIKRSYRRLALKYHPDKNHNSEECSKKFQEINYANTILSNPNKRKMYDEYGEMGLKMMDQLGEERINLMLRPWVKWVVCGVFFLSGFCFGCFCCCFCCFQCCFNFCCGKFKPKEMDDEYGNPFADLSDGGGSNNGDPEEIVIIAAQPASTTATDLNTEFTSNSHVTLVCEQSQKETASGESPPPNQQIELPGRFEPPPPYTPPTSDSLLVENPVPTKPPNYGSTN